MSYNATERWTRRFLAARLGSDADIAQLLATIGTVEDKANTADLADVAISGDYNDLTNLPDIPDLDAALAPLHEDFSTVTIDGLTAGAQTVYTRSIPGGTLASGKHVNLRLSGELTQSVGSNQNFTITLSFGGKTITTHNEVFVSNANTYCWFLDVMIYRTEEDQQKITLDFRGTRYTSNFNPETLYRFDTATEDESAANTLTVKFTLAGSSASFSVTKQIAILRRV